MRQSNLKPRRTRVTRKAKEAARSQLAPIRIRVTSEGKPEPPPPPDSWGAWIEDIEQRHGRRSPEAREAVQRWMNSFADLAAPRFPNQEPAPENSTAGGECSGSGQPPDDRGLCTGCGKAYAVRAKGDRQVRKHRG